MIVAGFDCDDGNSVKCRKHGVKLEDIEHAFAFELFVSPDIKHSKGEDRFIAVGKD